VVELLAAQFPFEAIYVTPKWSAMVTALGAGVPVKAAPRSPRKAGAAPKIAMPPRVAHPVFHEISEEDMARVSHFPTPSGVLAVGKVTREPLAPGALDRGLTLALDSVQDAGNVGTLVRVADWFGLDRVVCSPDCADLFNQKVINASMGSFARVRVHTAGLPEILTGLKVPVLGCDLTGNDVHALPSLTAAVIVVGSEGKGLSPAVKKFVTNFITIPRYGGAESLNAAVAAAIVCDNLRRTRG
jgi:TrmH family RNA methyltransferase